MENKNEKCSSNEHKEIDAINYCQICKIYMCNKCNNIHNKLCPNHGLYNRELTENFSFICKEENHFAELNYFCKNHNTLCCSACICKIKGKGNGQHTDCDVCFIEDIKDIKKNKLKENIQLLVNLSNNFQNSINKLKNILKKINENKDTLKTEIQKVFTKLRNAINDREDELIIEIDKKYEKFCINDDIEKISEKMPNNIKLSLEKGKKIDGEWKNDNLKSIINDCINIEKNIESINEINEKIKKFNNFNIDIKLNFAESQNNEILEKIKIFGNLSDLENWIESNIITSLDNKGILKNLIFPGKIINSKLLYRLSKNGSTISNFHKLCDNIKNNLLIIQTEKSEIFGCYCTWGWDISGNDLKENNLGILFNFSKNLKFNEPNLYIHKGCNDHGPYFYDRFYFNKTMNQCVICNNNKIINSNGIINIKEVEIFQIESN